MDLLAPIPRRGSTTPIPEKLGHFVKCNKIKNLWFVVFNLHLTDKGTVQRFPMFSLTNYKMYFVNRNNFHNCQTNKKLHFSMQNFKEIESAAKKYFVKRFKKFREILKHIGQGRKAQFNVYDL